MLHLCRGGLPAGADPGHTHLRPSHQLFPQPSKLLPSDAYVAPALPTGIQVCVQGRFLIQAATRPSPRLSQFSSVQSLHHVRLFATPWTAARQASLSFTNFWSLLKLMSIASEMPSNHLILRCPLILSLSIFPSIRVFSNESVLHSRWPKYWSFSFSISPPNEYSGLFL